MASLMINAQKLLIQIEARILTGIFGVPPTYLPAIAGLEDLSHDLEPNSNKDDGFLFAVPKTRRSVEKRRNRKFGWPELHWKPLVPKRNLVICGTCGHSHQSGFLCGTCFKKVMKETELIQKSIEAEYKLEPIDKEVIVLYEGEAYAKQSEFANGKRIVEVNKKRPSWFSSNLLQKSTTKDESIKDVPPSELA